MRFDYKSWLQQAQGRLEELYRKRAAIDEEIAALQRGIEGFSPLVKEASPWNQDAIGITEAVAGVFKRSPARCYSPTDIRDALVSDGMKLTQQNPLATIHQIISRLDARGVIKPFSKDGRTLHYYPESRTNKEKKADLPLSPERRLKAPGPRRRVAEKGENE